MLRAGTRESLRILGQRGPRVDAALHRAHPAEPHWYPGLLTVDPQVQTAGSDLTWCTQGSGSRTRTICRPTWSANGT